MEENESTSRRTPNDGKAQQSMEVKEMVRKKVAYISYRICPGTRETGGGQWGQVVLHNLEAVGASPPPPQLWTVNVVHFYFCLFLHVNFGLSQK